MRGKPAKPILFFIAGYLFGAGTIISLIPSDSEAQTRYPSLTANEAGKILVVMYHGIGDKERTWIRTRENFKEDLRLLYHKGYRPVALLDYVQNKMQVPAGYSPVVLTFDDGRIDNFKVVLKDGNPSVESESAVGILEQFHAEHPDFPLKATFFVNGKVPFGQPEWVKFKLNYLVSKGMDVGNHTTGHDNLSLPKYQNPKRIQQVIGAQARFLEQMLKDHPGYRVRALALCHGTRPKNRGLLRFLSSGVTEGYSYENTAVLNVGSGPAPAPTTTTFNPLSIPRVRASEMGTGKLGLRAWLDYFDAHPERRYISDGDSSIVTVPARYEEKIALKNLGKARLVIRP